MQFESFSPVESLQPYIKQYIYIKADGSTDLMTPPADDPHFVDGKHVENMLPAYGSLTMVRGAQMQVGEMLLPPDSIIVLGPQTTTVPFITISGWVEAMVVEFMPGGMHAVLGYDMVLLHGGIFTTRMLEDQSLHDMGMIIHEAKDAQDCLHVLNSFFLGRLDEKRTRDMPRVIKVMDAIAQNGANTTAEEMASVACLSTRQFRRVFNQYVGLSPKECQRIERFHATLREMQRRAAAGQNIDLMELVTQFGYFDMSHMRTEFKALGYTSPSKFRQMGIPLQTDFTSFFG